MLDFWTCQVFLSSEQILIILFKYYFYPIFLLSFGTLVRPKLIFLNLLYIPLSYFFFISLHNNFSQDY